MTRTGRGGDTRRRAADVPRLSRRALLPTLAVLPIAAATTGAGKGTGPASLLGIRPAAAQADARAARGKRAVRTDKWPVIPGAAVQVIGSGFTPGGKARLLWQANTDAQRSLGLLRADKSGRIAATVNLPESGPDAFTIAVRIGKRTAKASVAVEAPPGAPIAFGVYERSRGQEAPWSDAPLKALRDAIDRDPEIVMWYQGWGAAGTGKNLDRAMLDRVANRGAIPLITWEPWVPNGSVNQPAYMLSVIAGSAHDAYVRSWASQLAAWNKPVLLRFAHEMNGTWYPWAAGWNNNAAADYIAAWKYLRGVFDEEGADNVGWVWSPNIHVDGYIDMSALYPGDDYVDWIGLDGYNWGNGGDQRWQSFSQVFGPSIDMIRGIAADKPLMIAETASGADGGSKAAWMRSAFFSEIPLGFPEIRAIVWFDENKERPWRFDTDADSAKAFRAAANHAYYGASLSPDDIVTTTGVRNAARNDAASDRPRDRDRPRKRRKRRTRR